MPFYTAEAHNSLERGSRPYSVVEILREVFKEDFSKAIQCYMDRCPEGAAKAIGVDEARNIKLLFKSLSVLIVIGTAVNAEVSSDNISE